MSQGRKIRLLHWLVSGGKVNRSPVYESFDIRSKPSNQQIQISQSPHPIQLSYPVILAVLFLFPNYKIQNSLIKQAHINLVSLLQFLAVSCKKKYDYSLWVVKTVSKEITKLKIANLSNDVFCFADHYTDLVYLVPPLSLLMHNHCINGTYSDDLVKLRMHYQNFPRETVIFWYTTS